MKSLRTVFFVPFYTKTNYKHNKTQVPLYFYKNSCALSNTSARTQSFVLLFAYETMTFRTHVTRGVCLNTESETIINYTRSEAHSGIHLVVTAFRTSMSLSLCAPAYGSTINLSTWKWFVNTHKKNGGLDMAQISVACKMNSRNSCAFAQYDSAKNRNMAIVGMSLWFKPLLFYDLFLRWVASLP